MDEKTLGSSSGSVIVFSLASLKLPLRAQLKKGDLQRIDLCARKVRAVSASPTTTGTIGLWNLLLVIVY